MGNSLPAGTFAYGATSAQWTGPAGNSIDSGFCSYFRRDSCCAEHPFSGRGEHLASETSDQQAPGFIWNPCPNVDMSFGSHLAGRRPGCIRTQTLKQGGPEPSLRSELRMLSVAS